ENNAADTTYLGTVHFTSSDTSATLPANYTFTPADSGVHRFLVTLPTTGRQTVTVTDLANGAVTGQAGWSTTEFPLPSGPLLAGGITLGPDNNLWFTERSANKIGRITPDGTVTEFPVPTANSQPANITSGPDGNLWFTEYAGNQIGWITPAGVITE